MARPNGVILYRGPSDLDGAPIVVVATGIRRGSANAKTGAMVQTWILREDVSPVEAVASGADVSICGGCPHRGHLGVGRSCYVATSRAPMAVWRTFKRGGYPMAAGGEMAGKAVRLGSYGDPAAAPAAVWARALEDASGASGYTHQWRWAIHLRGAAMASVDSASEAFEAQAMGWRTFRIRDGASGLLPYETPCPASDEGGKRTQCASCLRCDGSSVGDVRAHVAIIAHGPGWRSALRVLAESDRGFAVTLS